MLGLLLNKILDTPLPSIYYCKQSTLKAIQTRKFVIENLRLVCLPDLTADFGVKTHAKLTPIFKLRNQSKTGIQSFLYTETLTPIIT